jgi:2-polyprenyl-3-methyl-5-hydroxy-6-metoxy-1,4-benzoquinol methylase
MYRYYSSDPSHTAAYLWEPVFEILRDAGAVRILDAGCGNGAFVAEAARRGFQAAGCDPSADGIRIARESHPGNCFEQLSVYDDPPSILGAPFDALVSLEVIEHLERPRELLRFSRDLLDREGRLILSTPYHGYLKNLAISLAGAWDRHWDPRWDGGHVKFFSRATLAALLEEEGFRLTEFRGAGRLLWLWKSMILVAEPVA